MSREAKVYDYVFLTELFGILKRKNPIAARCIIESLNHYEAVEDLEWLERMIVFFITKELPFDWWVLKFDALIGISDELDHKTLREVTKQAKKANSFS